MRHLPIDPRNKVLWHVDRLAAIKQGKKPAPVNVEIDTSFRCSLGCQSCHFAYTHTRGPLAGKRDKPHNAIPGGDLIDYELAKSIIIQLKMFGVRSVTWTGGGEPTLHPQFNDIIRFTKVHNMPQGIYTHGGHIDQERAELMKQAMTWVYVSLDECTPEQYRQIKGVPNFHKACQGVKNLVAAKGNATIGIGFLLHPGNWQQTDDMIRLGLDELGADYVQFRPTVLYDQEQPDKPDEDTSWLSPVIAKLETYKDEVVGGRVLADTERFQMYQEWNGRPYSTCHWAALQTVITPNGKVWTCVNKREHAGAELGDLSVDTFADIWQSAGGACRVDEACRTMCRGHIPNLTLDAVMTEPEHANFI